ncbi:MAG: LptF/LptG family permease [Pleurocapsa sp. SU_196_0]|nr:LptF/LptG family permease [Pleurocapsa sp. SU_196_0]
MFFGKRAIFAANAIKFTGYKNFSVNLDEFPAQPDNPNWIYDAFPSSIVPLNPNATTTLELPKSAERVLAENADSGFEDSRRLSELWQEYQTDGKREAGAQLGFKSAQPLASLVILLFGIPIAARGARSSGVAFGLSVVIAVGFYVALYLGARCPSSGFCLP